MPPTIVRDYQQHLIQTVLDITRQRTWWAAPINLGGGGGGDGGSGVPIGGIFGQLIQSKVAFDTTEGESLEIPASGASLVTNLNRIRYWLAGKSSQIVVLDEGGQIASGVRVLDFIGAPVTVTLASGYTDRVAVVISGTGGGDTKKVLVSSNDTTEDYLEDKIVAGTNVTITTLNEGTNETVEITSTGSGGGSAITVKDEGVTLTGGVTSLDFVGEGVTATASGTAITVTIPGGSGIASVYSKWDADAPPESASAYDDEFNDSSFDTGLWTEWDPGTKLTITEDEHGIIFDMATTAGNNYAGIYQALPAGDFTLATRVSLLGLATGTFQGGIALLEDAAGNPTTTDLVSFLLRYEATLQNFASYVFTDYNTFSSTNVELDDVIISSYAYLRVRRNGTTLYFEWSTDGIGWRQAWSGAQPFTPGEMALIVNNNAGGVTERAVFDFFRYAGSDVGITGFLDGQRV